MTDKQAIERVAQMIDEKIVRTKKKINGVGMIEAQWAEVCKLEQVKEVVRELSSEI